MEGALHDLLLPCRDVQLTRLLAKLLCYDPSQRLTPAEAMAHPFVSSLFPVDAFLSSAPVPSHMDDTAVGHDAANAAVFADGVAIGEQQQQHLPSVATGMMENSMGGFGAGAHTMVGYAHPHVGTDYRHVHLQHPHMGAYEHQAAHVPQAHHHHPQLPQHYPSAAHTQQQQPQQQHAHGHVGALSRAGLASHNRPPPVPPAHIRPVRPQVMSPLQQQEGLGFPYVPTAQRGAPAHPHAHHTQAQVRTRVVVGPGTPPVAQLSASKTRQPSSRSLWTPPTTTTTTGVAVTTTTTTTTPSSGGSGGGNGSGVQIVARSTGPPSSSDSTPNPGGVVREHQVLSHTHTLPVPGGGQGPALATQHLPIPGVVHVAYAPGATHEGTAPMVRGGGATSQQRSQQPLVHTPTTATATADDSHPARQEPASHFSQGGVAPSQSLPPSPASSGGFALGGNGEDGSDAAERGAELDSQQQQQSQQVLMPQTPKSGPGELVPEADWADGKGEEEREGAHGGGGDKPGPLQQQQQKRSDDAAAASGAAHLEPTEAGSDSEGEEVGAKDGESRDGHHHLHRPQLQQRLSAANSGVGGEDVPKPQGGEKGRGMSDSQHQQQQRLSAATSGMDGKYEPKLQGGEQGLGKSESQHQPQQPSAPAPKGVAEGVSAKEGAEGTGTSPPRVLHTHSGGVVAEQKYAGLTRTRPRGRPRSHPAPMPAAAVTEPLTTTTGEDDELADRIIGAGARRGRARITVEEDEEEEEEEGEGENISVLSHPGANSARRRSHASPSHASRTRTPAGEAAQGLGRASSHQRGAPTPAPTPPKRAGRKRKHSADDNHHQHHHTDSDLESHPSDFSLSNALGYTEVLELPERTKSGRVRIKPVKYWAVGGDDVLPKVWKGSHFGRFSWVERLPLWCLFLS